MAMAARFREPTARPGLRAAWWLARYALLYVSLCLLAWLGAALLSGGASYGLSSVVVLIVLVAILYGFLFALPTLVILPLLCLIGQCVSARALRWIALLVLPLIVVVLPVEAPPSEPYGSQLLIQLPVQVVFALLLRPASATAEQAGDDLLAAWGLASPIDPPPESLPQESSPEGPGRSWYPGRFWYPGLLGVWLWLVLLIAGGYPLLLGWVPLGPQRVAHPLAAPGATVSFQADPRHRYLIYQHYIDPVDSGETCRYGGADPGHGETWVWQRPPKRVTFDGEEFAYRDEVSNVDGTFEMSCDTGPLLVEDNPPLAASPAGPAAVTALSLPLLGIGYVAVARWRHGRGHIRRLAAD